MALRNKEEQGGRGARYARFQDSRLVPWVTAAAWMAVIFIVSGQGRMPGWAPWFEFRDVIGHWIAYAVLAILLRWALASSGVRHAGAWAFVVAVLYGLSDEFHQSFVPGRNPDVFDLVIDAAGAATAMFAFTALRRRPR